MASQASNAMTKSKPSKSWIQATAQPYAAGLGLEMCATVMIEGRADEFVALLVWQRCGATLAIASCDRNCRLIGLNCTTDPNLGCQIPQNIPAQHSGSPSSLNGWLSNPLISTVHMPIPSVTVGSWFTVTPTAPCHQNTISGISLNPCI